MIVRRLQDLIGTDRDVDHGNWVSRRLLLRKDGMGFSMHETILRAGTETSMWYQNHLEAVYCVEGEGEIEDLASGQIHRLEPGTLYALNAHDKHVVRATTDIRTVCVFYPPVTGREVHDENGTYPLIEED
ncbi:MAG: ectoine synthase [Candidatus Entotheonella factor]|uniref:L-ectoine synthase n=1 Tax=Entotheonella factor TaxID=1429438 RepID=W4LA26_ENTF1|nr:ectoine synthase [Candidatus Entotheonella palauensis]ETW94764.1 MAG: ectoine synthase [Candidatus Entotheonella factor]